MAKNKERIIERDFKIEAGTSEYSFRLKKKRNLWWLLLLLLPLLLLIKCERTVTVVCLDAGTKAPVEGADVRLSYTSYFLYDEEGFLSQYDHEFESVTDENGEAEFSGLKCSVFSYIFHPGSKMRIEAECDCYESCEEETSFHFHKRVELLMTQDGGLPVHVVDRGTLDGLERAKVRWRYNDADSSLVTDNDGMGFMPNVPACRGVIPRIDASAEGYYDTTYYDVNIEELERGEVLIKMRPKDENFHVDIVMCIDNTGSMSGLLNLVKRNALNFPADLTDCCAKKGKKLQDFRLRVISFGDLSEVSIKESGFMEIPRESRRFKDFVSSIQMSGGGDEPEDALEALAMAIHSDWNSGSTRCRHIIIIYTDASTHRIGYSNRSVYYPRIPMPEDFDELTDWWTELDQKASRLIMFAPGDGYWSRIEDKWPNTYRKPLYEVLDGKKGYNEILEAISNSL